MSYHTLRSTQAKTMIQKLLENKQKFFWSKSAQGEIIVGGYGNGARYYGTIVFTLHEDKAIMRIDIISGMSIEDQRNQTKEFNREIDQSEYSNVKNLFKEIEDYLELENTKLVQNINREELMSNLYEFLLSNTL